MMPVFNGKKDNFTQQSTIGAAWARTVEQLESEFASYPCDQVLLGISEPSQ